MCVCVCVVSSRQAQMESKVTNRIRTLVKLIKHKSFKKTKSSGTMNCFNNNVIAVLNHPGTVAIICHL